MPQMSAPVIFGALALAAATLGAGLLALRPGWVQRHSAAFSVASAALLLTFVLMDLLPHALGSFGLAGVTVLCGYLAGFAVSALGGHTHDGRGGRSRRDALIPVAGIGLHAFLDGVIYTVALTAAPEAGTLTAIALSLHKVPVAAVTFGIARASGYGARAAFFTAILAVGVITPVGMAAAGPMLAVGSAQLVNILFAFSAGLLLHVATGPLLAPNTLMKPRHALLAVLIGAGVALAISFALPHGHALDGADEHDHAHDHPPLGFSARKP